MEGGDIGLSSVDERVVEMTFKSSDFIKNVQATITALAALKDKLNFKGAEDSLNNLDAAGKRFSLSGIGSGIDAIASKFSTLGIIGITVLTNLVNKAIDAGLQIAKSLALDPIKEGFTNYESQINSTKTIMANTGAGLDVVTKKLDQLNVYANQTIYSFKDMASAIGLFSAAGVPLNQAVGAIKGMGNSAALSGAGVTQLQTAMYQMSQALSSGVIRLQDWNSLQNAGVASGKNFQQVFEDTSASMGKNVDSIVKAQGGFRNSLQTGWLTADVFTKAMNIMAGQIDATTGKTVAYSVAQLQAMGYTKAQAENLNRLSTAAISSATQIRTFTQMMDTLRDEVSTAWATVFKSLIGDLPMATTLFTKLHTVLENLLTNPIYALNTFVTKLQDVGAVDLIIQSVVDLFKSLSAIFKTVGQAWRDVFPPVSIDTVAKLIQKFEEFTYSLIPGQSTLEKLRNTLDGVFSVFKIGEDVIKGVFIVLGDVFSAIAGGSGSFLDITSKLGLFVTSLKNGIESGTGFTRFFQTLGTIIASPIKLIADAAGGFDAFGRGVQRAYQLAQPALAAIGNAIGGLAKGIASSIQNGSFQNIVNTFNQIVLGGILLSIKRFIDGLGQKKEGAGLFDTIKESFESLTGALKSMQTQLKSETLKQIAIAVGLLTLSIIALSYVNIGNLTKSLAAITTEFIQLVAAILIIDKFSGATGFVKLPIVAASLVLLAGAIVILSAAVVILGHLSWDQIAKGLAAITGLLADLTATILILGKNPAGLYSTAIGIEVIAVAMNIMAVAVGKLGSLDWQTLLKGVGTIAALLLVMAGFNAISAGGAELITTAVAMVIVGAALNVLSAAISSIGKQPLGDLAKGLGTIAAALLIMAGGLYLMEGALPGAAALIVASEAIVILSTALVSMAGLSWGDVAKALVTLAGSLIIISVALIAMEGSLPGSAALIVAAGALAILAPVLLALSTLSWEGIAKSLVALAGAFVVIGLAGLLLGPLTPVLLAFSAAIALLGVGILAAGIGVAAFGVGLTAVAVSGAAAFAVLVGGITALLGILPTMATTFGQTIANLAKAIGTAAPAIIQAFTTIMTQLLNAIITLSPKIAQAATVLITSILTVISANAPKIVSVMSTLIVNLLNQLTANTPKFVTAGVNLIVAIFNGISANMAKVVGAATTMVTNFIAAVGSNALRITQAGADMIIKFVNGLAAQINANTGAMRAAGLNLAFAIINGMTGGILNGIPQVASAAVSMASSALHSALSFLGINSPSKEFQYVGEGTGEGMVVGMNNTTSDVEDAASYMGAKALGAMQKSLANVSDVINGSIDIQPRITPVIDLTQARAGINTLNGLSKNQLISADTSMLKATSISAQNAQLSASIGIDPLRPNVTFVQNNTSPKALDAATIYRQTKNQISQAKEALPS